MIRHLYTKERVSKFSPSPRSFWQWTRCGDVTTLVFKLCFGDVKTTTFQFILRIKQRDNLLRIQKWFV